MGQKIISTVPDKPVSGESLMRFSVAGRKTQFVLQSGTAEVSFTLAAGGIQWLVVGADFWADDLPVEARNSTNIISPSEAILFPSIDAYIDVDNDGDHYIGGAGLTSGQLGVLLMGFSNRTPTEYAPGISDTASMEYAFYNTDSSDHDVYCYIQAKYITFADVNL